MVTQSYNHYLQLQSLFCTEKRNNIHKRKVSDRTYANPKLTKSAFTAHFLLKFWNYASMIFFQIRLWLLKTVLNNLLVWLLHELGFVQFYPFPVSLNAFTLHQPISDKSERQKSQIHCRSFFKNSGESVHECCCWREEGSVPAGCAGLVPTLPKCSCKQLKDVQVSPCSGKKAKQKEQSTQKSGGHRRGREEKKKRCRWWGNRWGSLRNTCSMW